MSLLLGLFSHNIIIETLEILSIDNTPDLNVAIFKM